jgi:cytochrome c553
MKNLMIQLVSVIAIGFASTQLQAADAEAGKSKAAVCAACHGQDGNSNAATPNFPKLAGQHASYIDAQLKAFRQGAKTQGKEGRFDPAMSSQAMNLSDEDIADISAYYASLTVTPGGVQKDLKALGEAIYRGGNEDTGVSACIACHGPRGVGNAPATFPSLSGQLTAYTVKQLKDFRDGKRSNQMMNMIAAKMTDKEIEAVASYIAGLH